MSLTASHDACPDCREALARPDVGQPWCPSCEWNLRVYDGEVQPPRGWRWLDRQGHRLAVRLERRQFAALTAARPARPGWTAARVALTAIAALLVLGTAACFVLGLWLLTVDFPSLTVLPGALLILLAVGLRPRVGRRPPRRGTLDRSEAPALFDLVDRVAAAMGAAPPDLVVVEPEFNAAAGRFGLRQRSVLYIGVPLWCTLRPDLRVALLAHELAHLVNGDPTRSLVVRPALETFRMLAATTGADRTFHAAAGRPMLSLPQLALELVFWAISRVFLLVHVGLSALAARDHQAAEYLADVLAAGVAGRDAMTGLLDRLVLQDAIARLIAYNVSTRPPERWAQMAESFHASRAAELPRLRQLTVRHTSLWDAHPPSGLRARLVEQLPAAPPAVALDDEEARRIDAELAGWYAAAHRRLQSVPRLSGAG